MKITKFSDGHIKLVACNPLLIHGSLDTRIVRQFDAGRLFLLTTTDKLTGAVETNARLTPLDEDPDWDRKNEARLLLVPARLLPRDSLTLTEIYLGRFTVMEARVFSTLGGNTMLEAHAVLAPFVMPRAPTSSVPTSSRGSPAFGCRDRASQCRTVPRAGL
jgi:hypothetical protein